MKVVIDIKEETYNLIRETIAFWRSDERYTVAPIGWQEIADSKPYEEQIPVSKELPNKNGWYICTCEGICNRTVGVVGYDAIQKKWGRGGVIAWQPLPEPYKKGGAE